MTEPTPEELEIIRKYCKHRAFVPNKSVEFLKKDEKQILACENCGFEVERSINWAGYVSDDEGLIPCYHCGLYIIKGEEYKIDDKEWAHDRCEYGDDF